MNDIETVEVMKNYWHEHSKKCDLTEMMLDDNAQAISDEDRDEIMNLLPDLKGKRVLELGAGIGRFSGAIAEQCKSLVAVDFMESFIKQNKINNKKYNNITYLADNVLNLNFENQRFDVIFSNWLLMYLTDEQIQSLNINVLDWLTPKGVLFLRESCFHQSGNKSRSSNPTIYRRPDEYENLLTTSKNDSYFVVTFTKHSHTYAKRKGNKHQLLWSLEKQTAST